ncbi:AbiTii domain-containing protein [Streptomyces sp. NPDC001178]
MSSISRLERDVLDESVTLASLLRQVLILGGQSSSDELLAWAKSELKGYGDTVTEIPQYRNVGAQLMMDVTAGPQKFRRAIGRSDLPEGVRSVLPEEVSVPWGVAEIQATIDAAEDTHIRLSGPYMTELAKLMTSHQRKLYESPFIAVTAVYWVATTAVLTGILDQVRTQLAEFIAEMRMVMPSGIDQPTAEVVQRAFSTINIRVGDHSPVHVTAPVAVADKDATATIGELPAPQDQQSIG